MAARDRRLQPRRRRHAPAAAGRQRTATTRPPRSSASPPPPRATRCASAAATPPPTPPAWPTRSSPPPATSDRPDRRGARGQERLAVRGRRLGAGRPADRRAASCCPTAAPCPRVTADTLDRLKPRGSDLSKDAQVIRDRRRARPARAATRPRVVEGDDAYERAAAVDRFFSAARGRAVEQRGALLGRATPQFAMPAAAWAARSGDAALPVKRDSVPARHRAALRAHGKPTSSCSARSSVDLEQGRSPRLRRLASSVKRISAPTPVESAIAFARYRQGNFGWGVDGARATTSRGQHLAPARRRRRGAAGQPRRLRAAAAHRPAPPTCRSRSRATCSACSPATRTDPGQAVYNRVWILGDEDALSLNAQARSTRITELIPVQATAP